ncbi:hypothetical protein DMN91_000159 [Ooceraea biroi]|uniref:tRNA-uridine aminocarboxypropyltransferase 1 n=1 Tax=Ooceraea biroi TaxID=2015173 RepID=A0A026WKY5_OOCBI|nr:DTW domain-containing protein 1 [Ooceraea biroi]EZA56690.1 DTW domain-containing protein [Ooceraea biroi]RLU26365.1 hypothetical protein DMN91_000159 [Ooceraea biroi]
MEERNGAGNGSEEKLSKSEEQAAIDRMPFQNYRIADTEILKTIEGRTCCESCRKSRKYFCYTCCTPVIDRRYFPRVKLPIKIDIIKHPNEVDGKSTAIHAAILAPDDVTIYRYPEFPKTLNKEETILIFPSKDASSIEALFAESVKEGDTSVERDLQAEFPVKRAIFIDSTWQQTKQIYRDKRFRGIRCVILKSRISQFWRHQKKSPRWYLATIEAIHQFLVELHSCVFGRVEGYATDLGSAVSNGERDSVANDERANGCTEVDRRYNGQYDNLLYFFKYMYYEIHTMYNHDDLLAYKRPLT